MEQTGQRVTITGISGFVGAQVCLHFLKHGGFTVKGTVRSKTNQQKIEPLRKAFGEHFESLELVEADLLDENSIIAACEGSDYIVHTASPFPLKSPKDEQELIRPAVDGTLAVMKAAQKYKVKKVVITSSIAAIAYGQSPEKNNFNEDDWTIPDNAQPYIKSKMLAEKAAWDFVDALPEDEKFAVITVNPGFIVGPNLNAAQFSSGDVIRDMMMGKIPMLPKIKMPTVDVRNVAQAHLNGVLKDEANGKRFILCGETVWFSEIAKSLEEKYGEDYKVPKRSLWKWVAWVGSIFNAELAEMYKMWDKQPVFDNTRSATVLGVDYITVDQAIKDMGDTLIETGYVEDLRSKK